MQTYVRESGENNWELDLTKEEKPLRNEWNEKKEFLCTNEKRGNVSSSDQVQPT